MIVGGVFVGIGVTGIDEAGCDSDETCDMLHIMSRCMFSKQIEVIRMES